MTVGKIGDTYIDVVAGVLYGPKTAQGWPNTGLSLIGPQGLQGTAGLSTRAGSGPPASALGVAGDTYLDVAAMVLFGPKDATTGWPASGTPLKGAVGQAGPVGPPGAVGPAGAAGPQGVRGAALLGAPSDPPANSLGQDGDFAISPTPAVYGPKSSGTWPSQGRPLVGPTGPAGPAGAAGQTGAAGAAGPTGAVGPAGVAGPTGPKGATGFTGASTLFTIKDPPDANLGNDGDLAITAAGNLYGPKSSGAWPASAAASLVGPVGASGATGPMGVPGPPGATGPIGPTGATGAAGADGPVGATGVPGPAGPAGAVGPAGPIGPAGPVGAAGATGATGPAGATGAQGLQGTAGTNGNTILTTGAVPANNVGANGDYALNPSAGALYGPKGGGTWPQSSLSLVGATGAAGAAGTTIRGGTGAPSPGLGAPGDFYIDTSAGAGILYGPKTPAGGYTSSTPLSLIGPQGPAGSQGTTGATGATGSTGPAGAAGAAGNTVITGTSASAPTSAVGNNGDYYLTTAYVLYGPKAGGAWPGSGTSLIGPQGSQGAQGTAGAAGATGPQGPQGPAGTTGAAGTSQIALGSQALGTAPTAALQGVTVSATPTQAFIPGTSSVCYYVPQAPCAFLGVQHNNVGVATTLELYDLTAGKSVWVSSQTAAGANVTYGQFGNSAYPMTQGNVHVWRVTGSGAATCYIMPNYLLPSAQPTAAISQPSSAGRYTNTTFTTTAAPLWYPGGSGNTWQAKWLRAGWVYGATATFTASGGTSTSATFGFIFQNLTTATNLFGVTATANGTPQTFGPFGSNTYPIVAGNAYGWFVVNAGTGIATVDTLIVQ